MNLIQSLRIEVNLFSIIPEEIRRFFKERQCSLDVFQRVSCSGINVGDLPQRADDS
jgi:hypothetical protein